MKAYAFALGIIKMSFLAMGATQMRNGQQSSDYASSTGFVVYWQQKTRLFAYIA